MKNIVIWGCSGHAKVLSELLEGKDFRIVAFIDRDKNIQSFISGVPVFSDEHAFLDWLESNRPNEYFYGAIAIGGANGKDRMSINDFFKSAKIITPNLIHSSSYVAITACLSEGVQILAKAIISAGAIIGRNVIINTGSIVEHECIISDGAHIGPGATLAGCVKVGMYSFIGAGSVILPRVKIGKNVIVGAGSVVVKDIPDNVVVAGVPARFLRENKL
ncbi:sugar acetyltransferase [Marinomonas sp. UCMA 3892]|uniref:NeuD/PglB/VioB family sugar acetyltransferase n=1 Tax=Marinomonas sp. UCMA 3892 TaxID=1972585 RepID=UPI00146ECCB9|nr:sugar acetyltransferase [Marinomonas sp. UCMA 3892]